MNIIRKRRHFYQIKELRLANERMPPSKNYDNDQEELGTSKKNWLDRCQHIQQRREPHRSRSSTIVIAQ